MSESQHDLARRLAEARAAAGYPGPTEAARAMGVEPPTYMGHENGSRGFRTSASRYADFFKVTLEWLLTGRGQMRRSGAAPSDGSASPLPAATVELNIGQMPRDLPVHGSAACGDDGLFEFNGVAIDYARRPPRLLGVKDAYALYVGGDSMSPWRENGQLVYVHPHLPVKVEDYVVVQMTMLQDGPHAPAYIKRLLRRTAKELRLLQYNPRGEIALPTAKIAAIHKILDWSELMSI